MTSDEKNLLDAMSRTDLYTFARRMFPVIYPGREFNDAPYLHLLASLLMGVSASVSRRQIINLPPRSLKSYMATVCFTAWFLGRDPKFNIMIASHTLKLASAHLNDVRTLMKSGLYRHIFPDCRIGSGKDSETEVETSAGGGALAVSFEAAPTGRGCDGLIIDDPLKADDAQNPELLEACEHFYRNALLTRLNHPDQSFVLVVMQRLAISDLAGRLAQSDSFKTLSLPLIATDREEIMYGSGQMFVRQKDELLNPQRMSQETLAKFMEQHTDEAFAAHYQQRPLIAGGTLIKRKCLTYIDAPLKSGRVYQSWDTALATSSEAAFTVCLTWRVEGRKFELVDVFRKRVGRDDAVPQAKELVAHFKPSVVLVEEANVGYAIGDALKLEGGLSVELIRPHGSKVQRLERCLAAFQEQMVRLPRTARWLDAYVDELLAFPGGRYNDQVDATTLFLNWVMPRVLGEVKDSNFRQHKPVLARGPDGGGGVAIVGRGHHPMGQPINLRPMPPWRKMR